MAITLIRTKKDGLWSNLMFKTIEETIEKKTEKEETELIIIGTVTVVDDELKALSDSINVEISSSQEEFHKKLRNQAAEKDQLITSHSTNPDWNPEGYVKNLK